MKKNETVIVTENYSANELNIKIRDEIEIIKIICVALIIDGLIGIYQNIKEDVNVIKFFFKASKIAGSLAANKKEIMNVQWMTFDDFLSLPDSLVREKDFKKMIRDYKEKGTTSLDTIKSIIT